MQRAAVARTGAGQAAALRDLPLELIDVDQVLAGAG